MMMVRCPACQTIFRVKPEHLAAHKGMVRCGHCLKPFNAREHFMESGPSVREQAPLGEIRADMAPAEQDSVNTGDERDTLAALDAALDFSVPDLPPPAGKSAPISGNQARRLIDDFARRLNFDPEATAPPGWAEQAREPQTPPPGRQDSTADGAPGTFRTLAPEPAPAGTSHDYTPAPIGRRRNISWPRLEPSENPPERTQGTANGPHRQEPAERAPLPDSERRAEPAPPQSVSPEPAGPAKVTDARPDSEPTEPTERAVPPRTAGRFVPHEEDDDDEHLYNYRPVSPPVSPRTRWLHGLLIGTLLGLLTVQAAYLFRDELTRKWPELRPLALSLCEHIGCELPLPRHIDNVSVETSDLEWDTAQPSHYEFNALIRNLAAHPMAYPHLELTLTDARDRPVVRRVIAPEEWQRDATERAHGLPPGQTRALRLHMETQGVDNIAGYRVYAFYP